MLTEGSISSDPVRVYQTSKGNWVGHITTPDGVVTLGPHPFDELMAVMADWLARAIREAKIEVERLTP